MSDNTCNYCGSGISPNKKYCDKKCYGADISKNTTSICDNCESEFDHLPCEDRTFCSTECFLDDKRNSSAVRCDECGEETTKEQNELDKSENTYCSQECHNSAQENDGIACENCNGLFKPDWTGRKYCSKKCAAIDRRRRVTVECDWCGDENSRTKAYVQKYDNLFCDTDCYSKWLSEYSLFVTDNPNKKDGRYSGFGSNWPKWQKRILKRADGNCENCEKGREENGRRLSVHHIEPRSEFINDDNRVVEESNTEENLVALCRSCHMKAEHGSLKINNE